MKCSYISLKLLLSKTEIIQIIATLLSSIEIMEGETMAAITLLTKSTENQSPLWIILYVNIISMCDQKKLVRDTKLAHFFSGLRLSYKLHSDQNDVTELNRLMIVNVCWIVYLHEEIISNRIKMLSAWIHETLNIPACTATGNSIALRIAKQSIFFWRNRARCFSESRSLSVCIRSFSNLAIKAKTSSITSLPPKYGNSLAIVCLCLVTAK